MASDPMYQIAVLSGGQLQISEQPQYLFASIFFLTGAISTLFFIYRIYKSSSLFPAWGILLFGLPFLLGGVKILSTGKLTLDRAQNTADIHRPSWLWHQDSTIPLTTIHRAEIRSLRSTDYIALVLDSGSALSFADSSQEGGKGQAVKAINQYIGYNDY